MGTVGAAGRAAALVTGAAAAYDGSAEAWQRGPEPVYRRLADALVAAAPVPLAGARVLDVGAGTGVAAAAARAGGATSAVATDLAPQMLRRRGPGIAAVCADAGRLPFRDHSFDLVTAAFCLGHLPDPVRAVTEIRRVGGAVVASAFAPGWTHPAKEAVDAAVAESGFVAPPWYLEVKQRGEPAVNDPEALLRCAEAAGFGTVSVRRLAVDSGLRTPAEIVRWRFGMAHLAPYLATLTPQALRQATARAEAAVAGSAPVVIEMLALSGC